MGLVVQFFADDFKAGIRQGDVVFATVFVGFHFQNGFTPFVVCFYIVNLVASLFQHAHGFGAVLLKILVAVNLLLYVVVCKSG